MLKKNSFPNTKEYIKYRLSRKSDQPSPQQQSSFQQQLPPPSSQQYSVQIIPQQQQIPPPPTIPHQVHSQHLLPVLHPSYPQNGGYFNGYGQQQPAEYMSHGINQHSPMFHFNQSPQGIPEHNSNFQVVRPSSPLRDNFSWQSPNPDSNPVPSINTKDLRIIIPNSNSISPGLTSPPSFCPHIPLPKSPSILPNLHHHLPYPPQLLSRDDSQESKMLRRYHEEEDEDDDDEEDEEGEGEDDRSKYEKTIKTEI